MSTSVNRVLARGAMSALFRSLKGLKNTVKATAAELATALKSAAKTGISTLDDILSKIKVKKTGKGLLTVADDVPVSKLEKVIKSADLDGLAKLSDSAATVTSKEKAAFKEIIGETAESQIHTLDELTETAAKSSKFGDLNIKIVTSETPQQTVSKLSKAQKAFMTLGKIGAPIALTIGVAYITIDGLLKATAARTGCFMVTTIDGKTESCKVSSLTCSSDTTDNVNPCSTPANKYTLNVVLCLISLEKTNDNTKAIKAKVCELSGVSDANYMSNFNQIMNSNKFSDIFDYIKTNATVITENNMVAVCSLSTVTDVDQKLPLCRMCDPGASPLSSTFVDADELGDNITFECRNPTILDTIIDVGKSTGKDLLSAIGGGIWGFIKPFAIAIGVFVVVAFVIGLAIKLVNQAKKSRINAPQPMMSAAALPASYYNPNVPATAFGGSGGVGYYGNVGQYSKFL